MEVVLMEDMEWDWRGFLPGFLIDTTSGMYAFTPDSSRDVHHKEPRAR